MADNPVLDRLSGFAAQPVTRQLSLLAGFAASVAHYQKALALRACSD